MRTTSPWARRRSTPANMGAVHQVTAVHIPQVVPQQRDSQRVAVNLPTLERHELRRGDALVAPGHFPVSYRLDVKLEPLDRGDESRGVYGLRPTPYACAPKPSPEPD